MRVNFNLLALAGGAGVISPFWPVHPLLGWPATRKPAPRTERRPGLRSQQKYTLREAEQLLHRHRSARRHQVE